MKLSIFLCACEPSVHLLWKKCVFKSSAYFLIRVFVFPGYITRIGTTRSYSSSGAFQVMLLVKNLPDNAGGHKRNRLDPELGRCP